MKEKGLKVIGWFFAVIFFFVGVDALAQGEIVCFVLFATLGTLTLPACAVRNLWKVAFKEKSKLVKPVVLFVLFIVATSTLPAVEKDKNAENENDDTYKTEESNTRVQDAGIADSSMENKEESNSTDEKLTGENSTDVQSTANIFQSQTVAVLLSDIPEYSDSPYIAVNQNIPFFTENDNTTVAFEYYSDLDKLGRCGVAYANICKEIMPTEERDKIGSIKPSAWQSVRYDNVEGAYLYNRCHLIGYQLAGENANEKNLMTGTRYLNIEGMLPFENMVADYVKETDHHVLYRVTPIFDGDNLLAAGVLIEAKSVEDNGEGILFNVFCYNVQPGININYLNGDSSLASDVEQSTQSIQQIETQTAVTYSYVLNKNTKKYHRPDCPSVPAISPKNRIDFDGDINEMIQQGYVACKRCNP